MTTTFSTTETAGSQDGHRHNRQSLTARAHTRDYEELGYRLHTRTRQITIAMTADTGCQSVLVGIKIIHRLGFKKIGPHTSENKNVGGES